MKHYCHGYELFSFVSEEYTQEYEREIRTLKRY